LRRNGNCLKRSKRPKSWHGCEKTPAHGGLRDTLLHIYYDEPFDHGLHQSPQRSR
jgi:hypothetical protein